MGLRQKYFSSSIFDDEDIQNLRISLLNWFENHGRHFIPWKLKADGKSPNRLDILDVYPIWIAEVMLQQTQLRVVVPYWEKWMLVFPTLEDLASSNEQKVLLIWQGLGYYSRARRIHQTAKILATKIGENSSLNLNAWPRNMEFWMALPGIGRTTSGSILSSAFNLPYPILDGNVKRVYSRLLGLATPVSRNTSKLWDISEQLLDKDQPRNFNQALMDLGSIICTPYAPNCDNCIWHNKCSAYLMNQQTNLPVKDTKKKIPYQVIGVAVIFNSKGHILIDQRLNEGLLGGLWEFPGGKKEENELIEETIHREIKEELDIEVKINQSLINFRHNYSHKRLKFEVFICDWVSGKPKPLESQIIEWVRPQELHKYPFPAANAKIINALIKYLD